MAKNSIQDICKAVDQKQLEANVSDYHISEIAQCMVEWELLAPSIKITDSEQEELKQDFKNRYRLQKRQALRLWRWKNKGTYKNLIEIFYSQKLVNLAESVVSILASKPRLTENLVLYNFERYLLDCYDGLPHPSRWQGIILSRAAPVFTDLTLSERPLCIPTDSSADSGSLSFPVYDKKLKDVLNKTNERLIVLFEGVAGSGKTTLSWYLCRGWAEKQLLQWFKLLIHIQLNAPELQSAKGLVDLVAYDDENVRREVASAIYDCKGRSVCLLLDGLDEASPTLLNTIFDLLDIHSGKQATMVPYLSFILTTRPNLSNAMKLKSILRSKITIEGFSSAKLHEFLKASLGCDSKEYQLLKSKFEINPQLEGLCGLPINAAIMAFLIQFMKEDMPVTQTGLYKPLLSDFLHRHSQTRTTECEPLMVEDYDKDIPFELKKVFKQIIHLAYSSLLIKKRLFTVRELGQANLEVNNTLGFLEVLPKVTLYSAERYYSFPHLSLQEFLGAIYVSQMNTKDQVSAIETLLHCDPLTQVLPFFSGLTKLSNKESLKVLSTIMDKPLDTKAVLEAWEEDFSASNDPCRRALALFNCLYESQDNSLSELPETRLPQSKHSKMKEGDSHGLKWLYDTDYIVSFSGLSLTPTDCLAIGHYFKIQSLLRRENSFTILGMGVCSDVGMVSFMKEVREGVNSCTSSTLFIVFDIHHSLGKKASLAFREFLSGQSNISSLNLLQQSTYTQINVLLVLKSIIEGLAENSSCVHVNFMDFSLNYMHTHYLVLMIRGCSLLKRLSLVSINLQKAIPMLSSAIKLSNLVKLSLLNCNIDDTALLHLGEELVFSPQLRLLNIAQNPYTDIGILEFLSIFCNNGKTSILMHLTIDDKVYNSIQETYQLMFELVLASIAENRSRDEKRLKYKGSLICVSETAATKHVSQHSSIGGLHCREHGIDYSTLQFLLQATGRRSQQF